MGVGLWRWRGWDVWAGAWRECVRDGTDELGLHPEWAVFRVV